jgi:hypothetical protein
MQIYYNFAVIIALILANCCKEFDAAMSVSSLLQKAIRASGPTLLYKSELGEKKGDAGIANTRAFAANMRQYSNHILHQCQFR